MPPLLRMLMARIPHEHMAEIEEQILMAAVLPVEDRASIPTNSGPRRTDSAKTVLIRGTMNLPHRCREGSLLWSPIENRS